MDELRKRTWKPTKEELDAILAEMQPIIRAFATRDKAALTRTR